jgi:hypothetical protein
MQLSKQTKLDWLLEAFDNNPHMDAASCLEAYRDCVDAYNRQEEARIKALAKEKIYGIQKMETVIDKEAGGTYKQKLVPMQKFRVLEQDVPICFQDDYAA